MLQNAKKRQTIDIFFRLLKTFSWYASVTVAFQTLGSTQQSIIFVLRSSQNIKTLLKTFFSHKLFNHQVELGLGYAAAFLVTENEFYRSAENFITIKSWRELWWGWWEPLEAAWTWRLPRCRGPPCRCRQSRFRRPGTASFLASSTLAEVRLEE